ncbi:MAG: glycosyltransferase [Acidobacteria bacterium]|nr:glycosyltransferase [Acidobacteriota bacterium]
MRIAINLRQFFQGKIGGMENYVRNVAAGLSGHALTIWVHESETENVRAFAPAARIVGVSHETGSAEIRRAVVPGAFDVFFCPLLVLEPLVVDIPCAVMMPDIQHEIHPEFFEPGILEWRRANYAPTARNADALFTLSHHAKQTIVDAYHADPEKIHVVHLDADDRFREPANSPPPEFPEPYLFFPANFWPHKNHENVLRALALTEGVHLVLSGAPDGWERVRSLAAALGLTERVHYAGYVDRAQVPGLYRRSAALLFATQFEGFGIPILEAFHCGTPVITSDRGSCVEVAGDAAILVDPFSPESIAAGIRRILNEAGLREELNARAAARIPEFSWARAVEGTQAVLERIRHVRKQPAQVEEWPRIGIVTPAFQMAHFLEETIQSVIGQGYPHLDYVVCDGGSSDGTVEILKKYEGRLRWVSESDGGQAAAINKGWHMTSGDVFAYLNADDTYLPGALETIARHFRALPNHGLIYGEAYHVEVNGKRIDRYPTRSFQFDALAEQCFICQPAAFLSRDAFAQAGMMNAGLRFALDYDLWFRVAREHRVHKVDEYLATSRMHSDNKTLANRRLVYQEIIAAVKTHYGYVPYEWLQGYACYLLDRKDQFFDRSKPSLLSHTLALLLGARHNRGQLRRYGGEWARAMGINTHFEGRWDDGWISRQFVVDLPVAEDQDTLRIAGNHVAPIRDLRLSVDLSGRRIEERAIGTAGPFEWRLSIPDDLRGRTLQVAITSNRTWRPVRGGDYRRLSCVISTLEACSS